LYITLKKMSNIAKQAIKIPNKIIIEKKNDTLELTGPKGQKTIFLFNEIILTNETIFIKQKLLKDYTKERFRYNGAALRGTTAALIKKSFVGLVSGFRKQLKLVGVGYKAELSKKSQLILKLGYSHPIYVDIPAHLEVTCLKPTKISIFGNNEQEVSNFSALVRSYKIPEPYKGKGILYRDETINLKEGKKS
jgi:large subunit ribosomal protein L6